MQQVIDEKLYDTETAEQLAKYAPITDTNDFNYVKEILYKTDRGAYFLYGEGGPATKYKQKTNGGYTSGRTITPLSAEEALEWCEKREIDGAVVAEEFDDLVEPA